MTRVLRDAEYARLCDTFDDVEAEAPTLCGEWSAHDLAAHLWVLKHDPVAWPGVALAPFTPLTDARMARVKRRWEYAELIRRLRAGGPSVAAMATDALEGYRHALGEYFVHGEDVRRANDLPRPAYSSELQDALWRRARLAARVLRRGDGGLVLRRADGPQARIVKGEGRLVVGAATELLLWVHGRDSVAEVEIRTLTA